MSFKDVRDLSEQLKLLGYPQNVPLSILNTKFGGIECFRAYSDIVRWLIDRLEPGTVLPGDVSTENGRIVFVRSATEFLVTKAGIKVNPKKLYTSSAITAGELLKITNLLTSSPTGVELDEDQEKKLLDIDLSDKLDELRRARELSSELTKRGATLYDLLEKETTNREIRTTQSTRSLELDEVEKSLESAITAMEGKVESSKAYLEASRVELNNLNSKLQRKTAELDRVKQRLQALQKVRPAYLEEYERLEQELRTLFEQYFVRVRCVDALKGQLATRDAFPSGRSSPIAKASEGSMTILPEGLIDSDDEEDEAENEELNLKEEPEMKPSREELLNRAKSAGKMRAKTGVAVRNAGDSRLIGSMTGGDELGNLDSSLGSDESESEIDLGDGAVDDLPSDLDENFAKLTRETNVSRVAKPDLSDEDF